MNRDEIVATVNRIFEEEFELEAGQFSPESHLITNLELDSLDAVDLVAALEHAFGGRVPEEEARKIRTVSDVYTLVETEIKRRASA